MADPGGKKDVGDPSRGVLMLERSVVDFVVGESLKEPRRSTKFDDGRTMSQPDNCLQTRICLIDPRRGVTGLLS
jgi:hypothetical protein